MKSLGLRSACAWVFATCIVAACGGKVEGVGDSSDSGGGGGGASEGSGSRDAQAGDARVKVGDAATKGDANVCVTIDVSTYATSCGNDDDCIDVTAGTFCSDNGKNEICLCGGAAVSSSEQSRYDEQINEIIGDTIACPCPYFGRSRCVKSACVFCPSDIGPGPAPDGCPDGG